MSPGLIDRILFVELPNTKWENIHVGIVENKLRAKCVNEIIVIIKYTLFWSM